MTLISQKNYIKKKRKKRNFHIIVSSPSNCAILSCNTFSYDSIQEKIFKYSHLNGTPCVTLVIYYTGNSNSQLDSMLVRYVPKTSRKHLRSFHVIFPSRMTLPSLADPGASTYLFFTVLALARLLASKGANVEYRE